VQTQEEVAQAAVAMEERAGQVSNVTYTHPNEDGSVSQEADPAAAVAPATALAADSGMPRVGRNDPCPCGSGKKFKLCHGRLS
jgi:preprotein translocase subunit SecA